MTLEQAIINLSLKSLWAVIAPQFGGVVSVFAFVMGSVFILNLLGKFIEFGTITPTDAHVANHKDKRKKHFGGFLIVPLLGGSVANAQTGVDPNVFIYVPSEPLPLAPFWGQFWQIVDWFSVLVLPMLGLVLAAFMMRKFIAQAFKGGD